MTALLNSLKPYLKDIDRARVSRSHNKWQYVLHMSMMIGAIYKVYVRIFSECIYEI